MHALLVGLHLRKFLDTLYVEPPKDMDQLRVRAARYMRKMNEGNEGVNLDVLLEL